MSRFIRELAWKKSSHTKKIRSLARMCKHSNLRIQKHFHFSSIRAWRELHLVKKIYVQASVEICKPINKQTSRQVVKNQRLQVNKKHLLVIWKKTSFGFSKKKIDVLKTLRVSRKIYDWHFFDKINLTWKHWINKVKVLFRWKFDHEIPFRN